MFSIGEFARLGGASIRALRHYDEIGLSLTQARRLLDRITLDELRGMLILRRPQLEHELHEHANQLPGVEARLRHIARGGPAPPHRERRRHARR